MKDKISKFIADILPRKVIYWAIVRAYVHATTKHYTDETPDNIGFSMLFDAWENKSNKIKN